MGGIPPGRKTKKEKRAQQGSETGSEEERKEVRGTADVTHTMGEGKREGRERIKRTKDGYDIIAGLRFNKYFTTSK